MIRENKAIHTYVLLDFIDWFAKSQLYTYSYQNRWFCAKDITKNISAKIRICYYLRITSAVFILQNISKVFKNSQENGNVCTCAFGIIKTKLFEIRNKRWICQISLKLRNPSEIFFFSDPYVHTHSHNRKETDRLTYIHLNKIMGFNLF